MAVYFITFGSHEQFVDAGKRLVEQAKQLHLFRETILFTGDFLKKDPSFWGKHGDFVSKNRRGYGYWLWKPYIVKKTMELLKEGDILMYADCGCEIDHREKDKLLPYLDLVQKDKIVGTYTFKHLIEKDWNKRDLIEKVDMNHSEFLMTPQHQAGIVFYLVCDETKNLVKEWYELACDYHNIDDSPSIQPNLDGFREHRHDQSIFSLLTKKYGLFSSADMRDQCVKILRNKSGTSKIDGL
jgi:hypothetical protein